MILVGHLIALMLGGFLTTLLFVRLVMIVLRRKAILDRPNARSSHTIPTPRGGGIGVIAALLLMMPLLAWFGTEMPPHTIIFGVAVLALISWVDDLRPLPAWVRLLAHATTVIAVLWSNPALTDYLGHPLALTRWAGMFVIAGLWVWFINLFNFMDGIDGISGVQTGAMGVGIVCISVLAAGAPGTEGSVAAILVGSALGFMVWNWHPARIFLGDVGSIPLGFLLGWLLLEALAQGHWAAAMILPVYYLADATITLCRRALRGAPVWKAHREHFYQQAVQKGWSHAAVSALILGLNSLLVVLAVAAETEIVLPELAVAAAALLTGGLLWAFSGPRDIADDR